MAASDIDQKILGRLCKQAAASNPLLSSCLYQTLGLSVLLSRKLFRARKLRKLDTSRDTKSVQLYHHIIWLSREGLSITEVYILPYCQDGEQGPECRVMAAKLRASFYHVFCLFHNHPPVGQLSPVTSASKTGNGQTRQPSAQQTRSRDNKSAFRDPIPSYTSDASYITNPFAMGGPAQTPPPSYPVPPLPSIATPPRHRTPTRLPPGLNIPRTGPPSPPSSASYLLPPLNFVPAARTYLANAASLATKLLPGSDPLRLSVQLEYAAFLWDCAREEETARQVAKTAIRDVYAAPEGMDDAEFEDAAGLVRALGGIARRGTSEASRTPSSGQRGRAASTADTGGEWNRGAQYYYACGLAIDGSCHCLRELGGIPPTSSGSQKGRSSEALQQQGVRQQQTNVPRSRASKRKRRAVEKAEQEVIRRKSMTSAASSNVGGGSRGTSPQLERKGGNGGNVKASRTAAR
ncbi:hypothetical protein H2203_003201 [Taxawa tesnikishii (nom. ined.)]|nr:hypothetical protein H2203_003201 [Dothideales sp. JES 119]